MNEVWRPIAGYEEFYEVSNLGRVRSFYRGGRILKPGVNRKGYLQVSLHRNGKSKTRRVNRLVALAFIPNPENKPEVNHLNGIKTDNRVENLEWSTPLENQQHAVITGLRKIGADSCNAKFTGEQICYIRDNPDNLTSRQLADKFNVDISTIRQVQRNKRYRNAGGKIRDKIDIRIPDEKRKKIRRQSKNNLAHRPRKRLIRENDTSHGTARTVQSCNLKFQIVNH